MHTERGNGAGLEYTHLSDILLGKQGRLVIPAALRKVLQFTEGNHLVARIEGERLVLEKKSDFSN